MTSYKKQISIFKDLEKIYLVLGDEIRATAYHNLVINLEKNELEDVSKKSMEKIEEIERTGTLDFYEKLKKDKNIESRIELTKILGVGPALAEKLVKNNIKTFEDFKKKYTHFTKLQKIGVKYHTKISKPSPKIFKFIVKFFCQNLKDIKDIALAGSYRTGKENPNDIDVIICTKIGKIEPVINLLINNNIIVDYVKSGPEDLLGVVKINKKYYRIDIKVTTSKYFASYLLFFGSGKYFSKYIRKIAKSKGYKLNQYGLVDLKNNKNYTFRSEESIFKKLNLKYVTPKDRMLNY